MRVPRGFTLIEMMVAVAIFGVLSLISFQLLRFSSEHSQRMLDRGDRLIELQRAMDVMQRDLQQLVLRRVRNEEGKLGSYYSLGGEELDFEFSRAGWWNFRRERRSDLQRVGYLFLNGSITRAYWSILDRAENSLPQVQELLSGVEDFQIKGISAEGEEIIDWPNLDEEIEAEGDDLLVGLKIMISAQPFGQIERIWALPVSQLPGLKKDEDSEDEDPESEDKDP